jgi:hypothetical protein
MEITADASLYVDDVPISIKQIQALVTIGNVHSQNKAAKILRISVPVLHRSIKDIEKKLEVPMITTSPQGTFLTSHAHEIIEAYKTYESRLKNHPPPTVACSPLYAPLVSQAVLAVEREGHPIDMIIANDELSSQYMRMKLVGVVVFDDPIYVHQGAETREKHEVIEIIKDTLIHIYRGRQYIRYKYGAQRIGFAHLKTKGLNYEIVGETRDIKQLIKSQYSFFINRSLVRREGLVMKSKTDPKYLMHSIFAMKVAKGEVFDATMRRLQDLFKK